MSSMTGISPEIRIATYADLPAIARCWYHAFFDDEVIGQLMHPHRKEHPEDVYWFLLRGIRERYWNWRHQFIVSTLQENGKERIVGAANWRRVGDGGKDIELAWLDPRKLYSALQEAAMKAFTSKYRAHLHKGNLIAPAIGLYHKTSLLVFPNRAADPSRASILNSAVEDASKYWTGEHSECWDLYVCGIHPDFQGKGIGKSLVKFGIEKADQDGTSASVLCGEKNRGFYNRAGLTEDVGKLRSSGEGGGGIALFRNARKT